jgi:hypothetical protein
MIRKKKTVIVSTDIILNKIVFNPQLVESGEAGLSDTEG